MTCGILYTATISAFTPCLARRSVYRKGIGLMNWAPGEAWMIRDAEALQRFEDDLARGEKTDFASNLRLLESLHRQAIRLGVFPRKNPMDGIEVVLRIATTLNLVRKTAP